MLDRILQVRLLPHDRCDVTRPLVHHREDALRGSLTLGVGLRLDRIHVGGTGREALAQHRNAAAGRGPRNHDDGVVAHGLRGGVQKGRRDHFRFLQSRCHLGTTGLVTRVSRRVDRLDHADALKRFSHPSDRAGGCFSLKALFVAVAVQTFVRFLEAVQRLLMIGIPSVQLAVGSGSLHENLEALVHR